MTSRLLRYDPRTLVGDYLRALFGAGLCLAPLVMIDFAVVTFAILAAIGAVFAAFGVRTLVRQLTVIELSGGGVRTTGPLACMIAWDEMTGMNLSFYSMRRRRRAGGRDAASGGWMELKLRKRNRSIRVDSSLDGFDLVVEAAVAAARQRALSLNAVTRANIEAMGFGADEAARPEDAA